MVKLSEKMEIYCLQWTGTNKIHDSGCYDNFERAERHMKQCNKVLSFWHRLGGHHWIVRTLEVSLGKHSPLVHTKATEA